MSLVTLLALAACHAVPATSAPPAAASVRVLAMISANAEWKAVVAQFPGDALHDTPFGQWLSHRLGREDVVFFHGGYGKVAAAGSTQYAIDHWHPSLIVNIGTCGGFGERKVGDIVLATDTLIYDLYERMGDAAATIEDYHVQLEPARWPARLVNRVILGRMVSADGDVDPALVSMLQTRYHAASADWESGAIAWVATRNHTPVLIVRAVTDLVDASGDPIYNAEDAWEKITATVMKSLVDLLGDALPDLH